MELIKVIISKKEATNLKKAGWNFDWGINSAENSQKIAYVSDEKVQGLVEYERVPSSSFNFVYLIELAPWNIGKARQKQDVAGVLFAFVAKDAFLAGFDGFVMFFSKTILVDHYVKKYGAILIGNNRLKFDRNASKKLIKEYLKEEM
jgi:hypothetical protein